MTFLQALPGPETPYTEDRIAASYVLEELDMQSSCLEFFAFLRPEFSSFSPETLQAIFSIIKELPWWIMREEVHSPLFVKSLLNGLKEPIVQCGLPHFENFPARKEEDCGHECTNSSYRIKYKKIASYIRIL